MKYITVKLTEDQAIAIQSSLEAGQKKYNIDAYTAFTQRIISTLRKARLANS